MKRCIATIGMFDGVHCGHRFLIEQMQQEANVRNLETHVFSFESHPLAMIRPECVPPMLSTSVERAQLIKSLGVDCFTSLDFTAEMQRLTAQEFMLMLRNDYRVDVIILGFNNRFGSDRLKDIADYKKIGLQIGIEVLQAKKYPGVCSSTIRQYLSVGKIAEATKALDRHYQLGGMVVKGKQLGRTIGFPTANISPDNSDKLIPMAGVYACIATTSDGNRLSAMVNIGRRPTVDADGAAMSIEVHLIDYSGDLYDKMLVIEFVEFIRYEQRFDSLECLVEQLKQDRQSTLDIIASKI